MTSLIKFNNEIIKLDEINNSNIYDLNIYIKKLKRCFNDHDIDIDNDNKFIINNRLNNENIYYDKKLHIFYYYDLEYHNNNKLYPYNINNLELEYPNIKYNLNKFNKNLHFTNI